MVGQWGRVAGAGEEQGGRSPGSLVSLKSLLLFCPDQFEKMHGSHPASVSGEDRQNAGPRPGSEFPRPGDRR